MRQTWEDSSSWVSTDVWCTVTSQAHDPIPHNLITPSSPAEASRPLHSTTALAAPSWPSILRAQVHVPGDHTMIDPSSEQLTTFPLHTHSPLRYEGYVRPISSHEQSNRWRDSWRLRKKIIRVFSLSYLLDRSSMIRESPYAVPCVSRPYLDGGVPGSRYKPVAKTHQSADGVLMSVQKGRAGEWAGLLAGFAAGWLYSDSASSPVVNGNSLTRG